jgi:hypothetical protein
VIRPRLKMARKAITQQAQQGQQPGMRDAPQVANQSNQGPAPTTQARARAIYRPGPAAGGAQAPSQTANRPAPGLPGFQTLAYQPVTRPGGISGGPTGVTMENAGDVLREWGDRGYTGVNEVPADPNDLPGQMDPEDATYVDGELEYAEGTEGFEDNKSEEQLIADMVRQYLEGVGNIDTTEQEALINEQMQEKLAMDLMNQRAAAGASGFEASGSLIGMEGDTRRGAARDATGARLDARRQAEEDAFGRAMGVAGLSQDERKMAFEEWKAQQQFDALNRWLESQGAEGTAGGGGGPDSGGDLINSILNPDGAGVRLPGMNPAPGYDGETATAGGLPDDVAESAFSSASESSTAPGRGDPAGTYTDENGVMWNLYLVDGTFEDGTWVKVRTNATRVSGDQS